MTYIELADETRASIWRTENIPDPPPEVVKMPSEVEGRIVAFYRLVMDGKTGEWLRLEPAVALDGLTATGLHLTIGAN